MKCLKVFFEYIFLVMMFMGRLVMARLC